MMHRQKVKLLLWFVTLLSILALVVAPALANGVATLTVEKAGAGTGTVTSDDGKINCGDDCEATYAGVNPFMSEKLTGPQGVEVTLTATPDEGSVFAVWSDCSQRLAERSGAGRDSAMVSAGSDPTDPVITLVMGETDVTCIANFALPVGGIVVPVNKLGLLAPWLGLVALAGLAALGVVVVRRRMTTTK